MSIHCSIHPKIKKIVMKITYTVVLLFYTLFSASISLAGRAAIADMSANPYRSAVVVNASSGKILFEKDGDATIYPASTIKLMVFLLVMEHVESGQLALSDMVQVTAKAAKMGGSQVYLAPNEQFSVEDLLYALMIQSANDAAVALAIHIAGSTEAFVQLMNTKAAELGMQGTEFYSVHGLPPATGQKVDRSSARDVARLARVLCAKEKIFKYTSTRVRGFRNDKLIMHSHNHLLGKVDGCDGLKTGYFRKAGFSIVATAKRDNLRIISVVMGCQNKKMRDITATELLEKGFTLATEKKEKMIASNSKRDYL